MDKKFLISVSCLNTKTYEVDMVSELSYGKTKMDALNNYIRYFNVEHHYYRILKIHFIKKIQQL